MTVDSDEDNETPVPVAAASSDDEALKPQKRAAGKLKPVGRTKKTQQPTPAASTQDDESAKSPSTSREARVKSKTALKGRAKPVAKPIYSFFNAATQRQQRNQSPSASPEKSDSPEQADAIHDDSDDGDSPLPYAKGSSVALSMRKRKAHEAQSVQQSQQSSSLPPPATQKFRKTSEGGRVSSLTVMNEDKRPWTEQFAPVDLDSLAVHKRKVTDVRHWLDSAIGGRRQKALVLKGAAGTGKTATINLLAKELGLQISEWRNPGVTELESESFQSTASQFEDFVRRAGTSAGLTLSADPHENAFGSSKAASDPPKVDGHDRQLLLIEEFPNTFNRTSSTLQSFRSTILQHVSAPPVSAGFPTPIVMIVSETLLSTNTAAADSFTAHRLLGPELMNHPFVNTIEFNAIAPTILQKALEAVILKEARKSGRRNAPGPQVIKHIAQTGDIRSAISSLEFLCLRGDDDDHRWSSKIAFSKSRKSKSEPAMTPAEEEALKLISNRETTLGIFHAVGKVVYNKRSEPPRGLELAQPPSWLPQHRRAKMIENDVDAMIDELGTDTPTFIAALHENYTLSCSSTSAEEALDSLVGCVDSIAGADLLSVDRFSQGTRAFSGSALDSLRQDEIAFQAAVRGTWFSLPHPVHRTAPFGSNNKGDAHKMFYPASLKLWKGREDIESKLAMLTDRAQTGSLLRGTEAARIGHSDDTSEVMTWQRSTAPGHSSDAVSTLEDSFPVARASTSKSEMLLERLPYMSKILSNRDNKALSSVWLEQMQSVTRANGNQSTMLDEDEDGSDERDDRVAPNEQWSTDKPDAGSKLAKPGNQLLNQDQHKEAGGRSELPIPVESSVEQLVLEDDDIEDD